MQQNKRAFTLIELLVVVLIIGVLSAIALPQYTKAVHKARFAEVVVRTKAMEDAIDMYMIENGGTFSSGVNLADIYPDVMAGLTPGEDGKYSSEYATYRFEQDGRCWNARYYGTNEKNGDGFVQVRGCRGYVGYTGYDGALYSCAYYDDKIGKILCQPFEAQGYSVFDDRA